MGSNRGSDRVPVLDNRNKDKNNQESILQKVVEQFRPEEKDGDSGIDSNSQTSATSEPKVNEEKETTTKTKRKNKKKKGSNSNSSGSNSNATDSKDNESKETNKQGKESNRTTDTNILNRVPSPTPNDAVENVNSENSKKICNSINNREYAPVPVIS